MYNLLRCDKQYISNIVALIVCWLYHLVNTISQPDYMAKSDGNKHPGRKNTGMASVLGAAPPFTIPALEADRFRIIPHAVHHRLRHIEVDDYALRAFLTKVTDVAVQHLRYVPYERFMLARALDIEMGARFRQTLRTLLFDRGTGGFTIGTQGNTTDPDDFVRFGTAVSHLMGPANFDAMSETYYARFFVKHTDDSDSYLRQAYRNMTLHTDGTFVDEPTDWLLMMKFAEANAIGGESRLLHLDDWEALKEFSTHPLASYKFTYKAPPSKNQSQTVERTTFFSHNGKPCICYIDQFVYPETIDQASYLSRLSHSLEQSPATTAIPLPTGNLIMLNNLFWLHGRAAFEPHVDLGRELMRQRGTFSVE
jgi:protein CsiD